MKYFNKDNEEQLDALEKGKLEHEKKQNKFFQGSNIKIILTTVFIAAVLIAFLVIPMLKAEVKMSAAKIDFHRLNICSQLDDYGYNSSGVSATYYMFEKDKLANVAIGEKDGYRFEYYDYIDDEAAMYVFKSIINTEFPTAEIDENTTAFTITVDGIYYYVEHKGNTVIFAYSPDGTNEIKQILDGSGYSAWNSIDDMTENKGLSKSDLAAGIVVCFMMLTFTLIVGGSCMAVVFASSNTSRSKFDETNLKMTERLKIMNENSKRPFITRVYTFAYYAVFLPWIVFCVLAFDSYFSSAAQAVYSKYSFWCYAVFFVFTVFNYIFSGFLNNSKSN